MFVPREPWQTAAWTLWQFLRGFTWRTEVHRPVGDTFNPPTGTIILATAVGEVVLWVTRMDPVQRRRFRELTELVIGRLDAANLQVSVLYANLELFLHVARASENVPTDRIALHLAPYDLDKLFEMTQPVHDPDAKYGTGVAAPKGRADEGGSPERTTTPQTEREPDAKLPAAAQTAGREYEQAAEALGCAPTDKDAYKYLEKVYAQAGERDDLPCFQTWCRNLRRFRKHTSQQKNRPRAGRARNVAWIATPKQLAPDEWPEAIRPENTGK